MKRKIFLIIFIFVFFTNSITFSYDLPLPPNTVKETEQKLSINTIPGSMETYKSRLSLQEIVSFYREHLLAEGYIILAEHEKFKIFEFFNPQLKENLVLQIDDSLPDTTYFSISTRRNKIPMHTEFSAKTMTNKDSPGKDLPEVPRYPGSRRITSIDFGQIWRNASYQTSDSKEDIVSFYVTKMPAYGWKRDSGDVMAKQKAAGLMEEAAIAQGEFLFFEKKDSLCGIMVIAGSCGRGSCGPDSEGNMIGILWFPKPKGN